MRNERVMVILGIPKEDGGPMPATIVDWPNQGKCRYQFLSPDQIAQMGGYRNMTWEAEWCEDGERGRWWLQQPIPMKGPGAYQS